MYEVFNMNNNFEILEIESVEELSPFEGEYVYDLEMDTETEHTFFANDILVHNSCYFSIEPILAAKGIQLLENGVITPASRQIIEQIGIHLNEKIQEWAGTELKSYDPRFVFKQEAICDVAVFMEKKRYIMHVLESEGIAPKKPFKYVGVEVQRSTYSEATKKLIKEIIESAILSQDKKIADKIFKEAYETFRQLPVEEISFRMSVRDIQKYSRKIGSDGKIALGTPSHVKGSIYYNNMLKQYGLTTKYEAITNGDKIKKFYTLKNKYNFTTISFLDKFPDEFKPIFGVDITRMFEKAIVPAIERLYNCIGWNLPSITLETHTDLIDFLSD